MAEGATVIRVAAALKRAATELSRRNIPFALVGGLAVSARGEPRFTRDVDLVVAVDGDREAESLVQGLVASGYRVLATLEQDAVGRLASVRLVSPGEDSGGVVLDLLFASSGIEGEIVSTAEPLELVSGLSVPVAMAGDLLALKILSTDEQRPIDEADIRSLLVEMDEAELMRSRAALRLVCERGFHRGRDLIALLEDAVARRPVERAS